MVHSKSSSVDFEVLQSQILIFVKCNFHFVVFFRSSTLCGGKYSKSYRLKKVDYFFFGVVRTLPRVKSSKS